MAKVFLFIMAVSFVASLSCSSSVPRNKSCRSVLAQISSIQLGQLNSCAEKLGFKNTKEKLKKSACIMKCVMQTAGLMNSDGSVSLAKLDTYIEHNFPDNLRAQARTTLSPCIALVHPSSHNAIKNISDEYCKSHDDFVKCMSRSFLKFCHGYGE